MSGLEASTDPVEIRAPDESLLSALALLGTDPSDLQRYLEGALNALARETRAHRASARVADPEDDTRVITAASRTLGPGASLSILSGVVSHGARSWGTVELRVARRLVTAEVQALLDLVCRQTGLVLENARLRALLEQSARARVEFISALSHELRAPLASIKGYASIVLEYESALEATAKRDFISIIDEEADRLRDLMDDMLDIMRLQADAVRPRYAQAEIHGLIGETLAGLRAQLHGVRFQQESGEPLRAWIDRQRVGQALDGLLHNAAARSPRGGEVVIRVRADPDTFTVMVKDEGPQIPPALQQRIFDAFARRSEVKGLIASGLGLALARAVVEAHEGRVWVESNGTDPVRFCVALPRGERDGSGASPGSG